MSQRRVFTLEEVERELLALNQHAEESKSERMESTFSRARTEESSTRVASNVYAPNTAPNSVPVSVKEPFAPVPREIEEHTGLTDHLLALYETIKPTEDNARFDTFEKLKKLLPIGKLEIFGSSANGFALNHADLDLTLLSKKDDVDVLEQVEKLVFESPFKVLQMFPNARVPIIKLEDSQNKIRCDIGINNVLALENTQLLKRYCDLHEKILQLGLLIKHWAKRRNLNQPYYGTLSSYAYIILLIFYLQQIKAIPNLQDENDHSPVDLDRRDLGNLFRGFFQYYCSFNYKLDVVSIREGRILTKESKEWVRNTPKDKYLFCIEDPFELNHNLGRLVDFDNLYDIRGEIVRATKQWYDLVSLFKRHVEKRPPPPKKTETKGTDKAAPKKPVSSRK